jgi:hypothetical protein
MPFWLIERLSRRHDRSAFDCGQPALNAWFAERAGQFDRKDLARTFVAVQSGQVDVLGYYAISTHRVLPQLLPVDEAKSLPQLDVPVALLGRLAVDLRSQGQGLGEHLLFDALRRRANFAQPCGIRRHVPRLLVTATRSSSTSCEMGHFEM